MTVSTCDMIIMQKNKALTFYGRGFVMKGTV